MDWNAENKKLDSKKGGMEFYFMVAEVKKGHMSCWWQVMRNSSGARPQRLKWMRKRGWGKFSDFRQQQGQSIVDLYMKIKELIKRYYFNNEEGQYKIDVLWHVSIYFTVQKYAQETKENTPHIYGDKWLHIKIGGKKVWRVFYLGWLSDRPVNYSYGSSKNWRSVLLVTKSPASLKQWTTQKEVVLKGWNRLYSKSLKVTLSVWFQQASWLAIFFSQ